MKEGRKIKIKEVVTKFLEKRKGEIEEKEFFPSVDNVIHGLKDFFLDDLNTETVAEYIRKWIKENKILGADGLMELKKKFELPLYNGSSRSHISSTRLSEKDINELLNRKKTVKDYRFIMEQYLSENPELEISKNYLDSNGKLKSSCRIHHINLDHEDNRLCNLWICEDISKHRQIHSSLTSLVSPLLKSGFNIFKEGKYYLN